MRTGNQTARSESNRQQQFEDVKRRIHSKLVDKLDLSRVGDLKGDTLKREIRITLLHELGHHHGLDEDDLRELGYG